MPRIYIVVEGQTEESFVNELLAPTFSKSEIWPTAILIGKPGHKGGVLDYQRAKNDIIKLLKQDKSAFCTTMFDYFRLPTSFPGMPVQKVSSTEEKAKYVESAMYADISKDLGDHSRPDRFIPNLQMHEFEGLLFSDCRSFANGIARPDLKGEFDKIREAFPTPEDINDRADKAPSKRILKLFEEYEKVTMGTLAAIEMGLDVIKRECPHFSSWVECIEALSNQ